MPSPALSTAFLTTLLRLADQGAAFHIVDTETTGLRPGQDRVIELASVTVRDGAIVDRFESLVNPGVAVSPFITRLTGITTAMLKDAPPPEVAFRRWCDHLGDARLFVAHNAGFDWDFLQAEFARTALAWPFGDRFCTVQLARHCLPQLPKHKLEHLIAHYGIRVPDRHRALADVEATADVFLRLLDQLRGTPSAETETEAEAEPSVPGRLPPGAWEALLGQVRAASLPTAAMLEQHGAIAEWAPDGALVLRLTPVYHARLQGERARFSLVESAVRTVLGHSASLRLEPR